MYKLVTLALVSTAAAIAVPAQATVTYYTSQATFIAALGGSATVEDFSDTTLVPGLSFVSSVGTISGGVFNDRLVPASQTTTFSFGTTINGFGGFFDLRPGGPGLGIAFNPAPGSTLTEQVPDSYSGQFFGFISTDGFSSLLLTTGTQGSNAEAETYTLDNLTFGKLTAAVPETTTWAMMVVGFGLAGSAMRRRKVNVSFA